MNNNTIHDPSKSQENVDRTFNTGATVAPTPKLFKPNSTKKRQAYDPYAGAAKLKESIVSNVRPLMVDIWNSAFIRERAVSGNEDVFRAMLQESYVVNLAVSIIPHIQQIVSVITNSSIKHPTYVSDKYTEKDLENAIEDIPNSYVSKVFYKNKERISKMFEASLSCGLSFMQIESDIRSSIGVKFTELSALNCIWDTSVLLKDLHTDGSFFLIEDCMSYNSILDTFNALNIDAECRERLHNALKARSEQIDTLPTWETERYLVDPTIFVVGLSLRKYSKKASKYDSTKVSDEKLSYNYSIKDRGASLSSHNISSHKLTVIYSRDMDTRIVSKILYVNDSPIISYDTESSVIPIMTCAPFERTSVASLKERFLSVYDNVSWELKQMAGLSSSYCSALQNGVNNSILVSSDSIPNELADPKVLKNNIIPVKSNGRPLTEVIQPLPGTAVPAGTVEMLSFIQNSLVQKLNLLTQDGAANSAEQEQLRVDNQVRLSSHLAESLDTSVVQFGEIMQGIIIRTLEKYPDIIQDMLPVATTQLDSKLTARISSFISSCSIVLEESEYHTTQKERDLKKFERASAIIGSDNVPMSMSDLLDTLGASQEAIAKARKAQDMKDAMEQEKADAEKTLFEAQLRKENLEAEKIQAEIEEIRARRDKYLADASKALSEAGLARADKSKVKEELKVIGSKNAQENTEQKAVKESAKPKK